MGRHARAAQVTADLDGHRAVCRHQQSVTHLRLSFNPPPFDNCRGTNVVTRVIWRLNAGDKSCRESHGNAPEPIAPGLLSFLAFVQVRQRRGPPMRMPSSRSRVRVASRRVVAW